MLHMLHMPRIRHACLVLSVRNMLLILSLALIALALKADHRVAGASAAWRAAPVFAAGLGESVAGAQRTPEAGALATPAGLSLPALSGCATPSFGAATNFGAGSFPRSVAVGDFNLDGKPDLAVANSDSDNVSVLLGNGLGGFAAATNFGVGSQPFSVAVGDFNLDGKPDLAVANLDSNNVSVLLGNGLGGFAAATNFGAGGAPYSVAVGDFNLDGKPDLAVANFDSNNVSVLRGNGLGGFAAAANFGVGTTPVSVAVGDFNLDGKPDLAVANRDSDNVSVLLNNCIANTNTAPSITPLAVTRTAGSPSANSQIATAADAQDAANILQIAISSNGMTFGNSASLNGVMVTLTDSNAGATGTNPDALGKVFADVVAACTATGATFTLRVTDSSNATSTASLNVTVTANSAPVLTYNSPAAFVSGSGTTVNPATGPSDNGSVASIAVQSQGAFTGTVTVNNTTGVVTISNAASPGTHTITIRATDNCGLTKDASFTLSVFNVPIGTNVTVTSGSTSITFANVTVPGATTVTPISPPPLGQLPSGYVLKGLNLAFDITTTAVFNGAITVCFSVPQVNDEKEFAKLRVLHEESNRLIDRTVTPNDFANRRVCAQVTSLSPFVVVFLDPVPGPGTLADTTSPVNDQKAGSVLIYNIYTSATDPNRQNTRISLTNINPQESVNVHLFLVDGSSCAVADSFICLTANQTVSFLTSDIDPGTTGYIVAVATNTIGCPLNFNYLIGDEYVKFATGHAANLGAEAITAIDGGLPPCNDTSSTAELKFDGLSYNVLPHVLAADNIGSRADGNDTLLILNRLGGNLGTGAGTLTNVFGILYDDAENPLSFGFSPGTCQFRSAISGATLRTTPRFEQFVPAGRTGWFKVWMTGLFGMTGAIINANPNAASSAGAYNQGHNLHKLTTTSTVIYTIPVFPPSC